MGIEYDSLCRKIRSKLLSNVDLPKIKVSIQRYFQRSCEKGHKEMAQWLYWLSKQDENIKILINAENDRAFRQSCENGHKDTAEWLCGLDSSYHIEYNMSGRMVPCIKSVKAVLQENDTVLINKLLVKSKGLRRSSDDCMVCLDDDSPYWIWLDCGHEVCSSCFININRCPLRCSDEVNMGCIMLIQ
jgi:hypothetical protein